MKRSRTEHSETKKLGGSDKNILQTASFRRNTQNNNHKTLYFFSDSALIVAFLPGGFRGEKEEFISLFVH